LQERKIREYITKSYQPPCIGCFRLCLIAWQRVTALQA
jgi:hypothetical protein